MGDDRLSNIRSKLLAEGFTEDVIAMMGSKYKEPSASARGTLRTYQLEWKRFADFCTKQGRRKELVDPKDVANFLAERYKEGASGSKIDATITALDMTRRFLVDSDKSLANDPVIKELRRTAKKKRPPPREKKPNQYFDPALIYHWLAAQPENKDLTNINLRRKVVTLMVLDALARGSDLARVCGKHMRWQEKKVTVYAFWTKEEKKLSWTPFVFRCSCDTLKNACTFCAMRDYEQRPKVAQRRKLAKDLEFKTEAGSVKAKPFFISTRCKTEAISKETLRSDLKAVMLQAGIDHVWTPHDLRGATASKLWNLQAGQQRVLDLGRWRSKKTFQDHYFKRSFFLEASPENRKLPTRYLLRQKVSYVDEAELQEIEEKLNNEANS